MIWWHDGRGGSSTETLPRVAAAGLALGVVCGFVGGLLSPRVTGTSCREPRRPPDDDHAVRTRLAPMRAEAGIPAQAGAREHVTV